MNLKLALNILENNDLAVAKRFEVLTGFNSETGEKNKEKNWLKALNDGSILSSLGVLEVTEGGVISGVVSWAWGSKKTTDTILKEQYKLAIVPGDTQFQEQQKYIDTVVSLFKKYEQDPDLSNFEFDIPQELAAYAKPRVAATVD